MRHIFTKMLLMIAPMIITINLTKAQNPSYNTFSITTNDKLFAANPNPMYPSEGFVMPMSFLKL